MTSADTLDALAPVAAAALGGLAVGIERQWSERGHFAGVRTFTLLGGAAGLAGWLWASGHGMPATVLLAGIVALVVVAYHAASHADVDGTTEVAALVVAGAGFLSGLGALAAGSALVAVTALLLVEKSRLHGWVRSLNDAELQAGARFAVMAVVVLPLLPEGPYGPLGGIRPRLLWMLVLLFSGLSFAGYIARRLVGAERGYAVAGLLGGLVSSTQVTLVNARTSAEQPAFGSALAGGVLAACTVLFARTTLAAAVLAPELARELLPLIALPAAVGVVATAALLRPATGAGPPAALGNPLNLRHALQMALLFQGVLMLVQVARDAFGAGGLLGTAALVGLTDVDAVTVSMVQSMAAGTPAATAAAALAVGIISNTLLKLVLAAAVGSGRFRVVTVTGLAAMSAASAASLAVLWYVSRLP